MVAITGTLMVPAWVITRPSTDGHDAYWTEGALMSEWCGLSPPHPVSGTIRIFDTKAAAQAAYRKAHGRLPRDHRAVHLTPEQAAIVRGDEEIVGTVVVVRTPRSGHDNHSAKIAERSAWWDDVRAADESIREHARKIAYHLPEFRSLIIQAKTHNLHTALGFKSWTAYIADVIGKEMTKLPLDDRRQIVAVLSTEGMSQRAIAAAINVSQKTIDRDLDQLSHDDSTTATVTGLDNKTHPKHKPNPNPNPNRDRTIVDDFRTSEDKFLDVINPLIACRHKARQALSKATDAVLTGDRREIVKAGTAEIRILLDAIDGIAEGGSFEGELSDLLHDDDES